jgi:hypothetical protein
MPLLASVGPYALDARVEDLPGLSEFSELEYLAVSKFFADEKIYTAPDVDFLGFRWSVALSAANGHIYKISPQFLTNDSNDARRAFAAAEAHLGETMGNASERGPQFFLWRVPPGNVILEQVQHLDVYCVQFFVTGGEYFVQNTLPAVRTIPSTVSSEASGASSLIINGIRLIGYLYALSLLIAGPYYNWQYAQEHSLGDWLVWGEIAPTAKAFVWPYFVLQGEKRSEAPANTITPLQRQIYEMNIVSAVRAIGADVQAEHMIDTTTTDALTPEQIQRVIAYAQESLASADTTTEDILNRLYPEFGTRFKRDFAGGQRFLLSGLKSQSREDLEKFAQLNASWRAWYDANQKRIDDSFNAAVP